MRQFLYKTLKLVPYWILKGAAIILKSKIGAIIVSIYVWSYFLPKIFPFLDGPVLLSGERPTFEQVVMQAKKDAAKFNRSIEDTKRREKLRRSQTNQESSQQEKLRRSQQGLPQRNYYQSSRPTPQAIERPNQQQGLKSSQQFQQGTIQQHNLTQTQKEAVERTILGIKSEY